jgi:hypothetical protein
VAYLLLVRSPNFFHLVAINRLPIFHWVADNYCDNSIRLEVGFPFGQRGAICYTFAGALGVGINLVALAIVFLLYSRLAVVPEDAKVGT